MTPSDMALSQRDPTQDPVATSVATAAGAASGQACSLTAWLQDALQNDPQVQAALTRIPKPALSLSNALMLWDGDWTSGDAKAAAGIAAIRAAVLSGIRSAPARCVDQQVRGPELMTLNNGRDTTVIAIGSGDWRWADLLGVADINPAHTEAAT